MKLATYSTYSTFFVFFILSNRCARIRKVNSPFDFSRFLNKPAQLRELYVKVGPRRALQSIPLIVYNVSRRNCAIFSVLILRYFFAQVTVFIFFFSLYTFDFCCAHPLLSY
uniref:Uncharacterized protein n=1 Tax=Sipha flava TaxID=143950 RepID=A0A2S2QLH9_9HEMI